MFEKKKIIIIVLNKSLKAIVAIIIAAVLITILSKQISKIGDSLLEKRRLSFIISNRSEIIAQTKKDLGVIGDNYIKIQEALPPANNILNFVAALETLGNKNSTQYTYRFGTPSFFSSENEINIAGINYDLIASGSITTLINYLKDFEKIPYFTSVSSIHLTSPADHGWENNAAITIKAQLYARQ